MKLECDQDVPHLGTELWGAPPIELARPEPENLKV